MKGISLVLLTIENAYHFSDSGKITGKRQQEQRLVVALKHGFSRFVINLCKRKKERYPWKKNKLKIETTKAKKS